METTQFYRELQKLKEKDSSTGDGLESDRRFAERLGLTNKIMTYYKRGTIPRSQTIKQIVDKGGYDIDAYYRLMGSCVGVGALESKRPASERGVPIYSADEFDLDGVMEGAEPLYDVIPPVMVNKVVSRTSLLGVKLAENNTTCEPKVPRGSVVVYSNSPCEPKDRALYVFSSPNGARVRMIVLQGRQMWWTEKNLDDLTRIKMDDFRDAVMGQVVMIWSLTISV